MPETGTQADHSPPRHQLIELTAVRLREFLREPELLFWSFAFPLLMTCALGVAFSGRSDQQVPVGVVVGEGSDALTSALAADPHFNVKAVPAEEVEREIRTGAAALVVVPGEPVSYRYDAARPESQAARLAVDAALQTAAGRTDAFRVSDQPVHTVGSRYVDWVIPGLLGMGIMSTGMWSVGFSIATARSRKLLKRLAATPMVRGYYLAAFVLSRLLFLIVECLVLLGFAWLVFGVAPQGSLLSLAVVCLVGALSFGGLALLVASRARTIEAISGLLNFVMLPMWLLSGVFFAATNFPEVAQPLIQALPLTALVDALRAVINDGDSLARVLPELAILGAWGAPAFALALRLFRWQ